VIMMKFVTSQWPRSFLFATVTVIAVSCGPTLIAQEAEAASGNLTTASDPVFLSWQKQESVKACGQCHYEAGGGFAKPDVSFSRQNELKFWLANDKHAIARRRVEPLNKEELADEALKLVTDLQLSSLPADWFGASNVLSRRICEKLGYDVTTPDGYATFRNNCLTCHGGYSGDNDNQDFAKDGGAQPGISCNFCHQIEANKEWIPQHGIPGAGTSWRNLAPTAKTAAGMRDLVNVATQATNCYDCHIGNRDKNMFVTHVMYAAGHPPLPSIELQTFCSSMPQHWQSELVVNASLENVSAAARDDYFQQNFPALFATATPATLTPGATLWNTRKMIVGALAARLHGVSLLADSATPERWADYSLYDCAACHHELREPSSRQARGYAGAPGRPRQFEWPEALLTVALDVSGPDMKSSVTAVEAKLTAAFSQTPFGEPAAVASIATELQAMLETAVGLAQGKPFSAQTGREVIRRLATTPKEKLLVYDSGRQVVWAIQAIAAELEAVGEPLPAEFTAKIAALGDPAVTGIEATLPAGRQVFIYPENLNADLARKANYSPDRLAENLMVIASEIVVRPEER